MGQGVTWKWASLGECEVAVHQAKIALGAAVQESKWQ